MNKPVKYSLLSFILLFSILISRAQDSLGLLPKKSYVTQSLGTLPPPQIDGLLDDAAWDLVAWGDGFIEQRPDENTAPGQQTAFKIVYAEKFLYIGIRCFDSEPDSIVRRLSRRDGFEGDWVAVFLDSYHDRRTAFGFVVTAAGVKGDIFESNNGSNEDDSWNPIWYVKSRLDEQGWSAEMKIPLSQLKFGKAEGQVWGLQVMRRYFREEERSVWQRLPAEAPGFVSEFGELHGLLGLQPQKQVEIQPYGVARMETYPGEEGNPFRDGRDAEITGGLDAKLGITNDLTLDLTVNPDFGQVEADPSAIALDGFQIFFEEKRPFFVENKNIFDFSVSQSQAGNTFGSDNVFYSRRIGRSPQGRPDTQPGSFVDRPDNTPIIGAAKFSGKTNNGWSIGVLESVTARRHATVLEGDGSRRKEVVEPLTNYFVGRLQKDFNQRNSYAGGIFTATNREPLGEELDFLHRAAYTGALDFKHQWDNRHWYVGGKVILSHVKGSERAIASTQGSIAHLFQRVDAGHLSLDSTRTSLTGSGGNLQIGKTGKGHWGFESGGTWRSPELELNDLGFQRQADDFRHYTWLGYQTLKPGGPFRKLNVNYNHWSAWDFEGNHNLLLFNSNGWANWKGNWFSNIGFNFAPIAYSNSALRGGPRLRLSPWMSYQGNVETDGRKRLTFSMFHSGKMALDRSMENYYLEVGMVYQPMDALQFSAYPGLEFNRDQLQFIGHSTTGDGAPRYVNGSLDQHTLSLSLRLNYTINPDLSIQYWGQPFISRGRYTDFKSITDATAERFEDRFVSYGAGQIHLEDGTYRVDEEVDGTVDFSFGDPDFSTVQFRSNLVVRWEYVPGSEIFLVWSQDVSRSADPSQGLLPSLGDQLFGEKPQNIFLLKATYRFIL